MQQVEEIKKEAQKKDSDNSDNTKRLQEVVTTARGAEQPLIDAPNSISVISKDELETKPYRDLGEAIAEVPGVDITRSKTGGFNISIRGFESKYTLILIDGKRQNASDAFDKNGFNAVHTSFIPPISMIERIEVIRGPASTLYGSDAIGGVINIITKKNPDKFGGSITLDSTFQEDRLTYGNSYSVNGYISTPIIKNILSLSARGKYYAKESSRWIQPNNNITGNTAGLFDLWNLGGRLNYTINSKNNIYLDGEYFHQGVMGSSLYSTTNVANPTQSIFSKANAILNHDGDYGFGQWNSYLQYGHTDNSSDTTQLFSDNYIARTQLVSKLLSLGVAGDMSISGGAEVWYERFKDGSTGNGITDISYSTLSQTQFSLFAEDEYQITSWVILTFGLRYTYGSIFKSAFTPRAYVVFKPLDSLTIKGGVSTGYKVPSVKETILGVFELNSQGRNPRYGNPSLQPEKSINYELSINHDTDYTSLTVTGFYTYFLDKLAYDDIIARPETATTPPSPPINDNDYLIGHGHYDNVVCNPTTSGNRGTRRCSVRINIGRVFSAGVETSFKLKPIYGIYADLSYTFVYSKQLTGANAGLPIQNQPRHIVVARLGYNYKGFGIYIKSTSRLQTPVAPSSRALIGDFYRDYTLVDLGLNYRFDKTLLLSFSINNLLNQSNFDWIPNAAGTSYINAYQNTFDGRSYWVSLRKDF